MRRWLIGSLMLILGGVLTLGTPGRIVRAGTEDTRYFHTTGHIVKDDFWRYWSAHGGLSQYGYPLTEEFTETSALDGKTYTVQYFERAVFEAHPENAGTPYTVLLAQLGTFRYHQKYPTGAPNQRPSTDRPRSFPQTGHTLGGPFRAYWEAHGGLAQQGYPISDEFTEISELNNQPYTVQYFERAVFEYHPENAGTPYAVLLSQLGRLTGRSRYPQGHAPRKPIPVSDAIVMQVVPAEAAPEDVPYVARFVDLLHRLGMVASVAQENAPNPQAPEVIAKIREASTQMDQLNTEIQSLAAPSRFQTVNSHFQNASRAYQQGFQSGLQAISGATIDRTAADRATTQFTDAQSELEQSLRAYALLFGWLTP